MRKVPLGTSFPVQLVDTCSTLKGMMGRLGPECGGVGQRTLIRDMGTTWWNPGLGVLRAMGILQVELEALEEVCLLYSFAFHPSLCSSQSQGCLRLKGLSPWQMQKILEAQYEELAKGFPLRVCLQIRHTNPGFWVMFEDEDDQKNKESNNSNHDSKNSKSHHHSCFLEVRIFLQCVCKPPPA